MKKIKPSETLTSKTKKETPQMVEVLYFRNLNRHRFTDSTLSCERSKPLFQSRKLHALPYQQCVFWRCYERHYFKHANHHLYGDYLCHLCLRSGAGNTNLSSSSQRRGSHSIYYPYHVLFGRACDHLSPASSAL